MNQNKPLIKTVTINKINHPAYLKIRSIAVQEGKKVYEKVNEIFKQFISRYEEKTTATQGLRDMRDNIPSTEEESKNLP